MSCTCCVESGASWSKSSVTAAFCDDGEENDVFGDMTPRSDGGDNFHRFRIVLVEIEEDEESIAE